MYDILVFLFENCQQAELAYDRERVAKKLSAAGFEDSDISEALHWLAGVLRAAPAAAACPLPDARTSFRAFAPRELAKLDVECRGFLLTLEHSGILTPQTRELVLERSLAASGQTLTLEQLKLIVLMVLWNQQTPTSQLLAEDLFTTAHSRLPN
jgi:Smg protein